MPFNTKYRDELIATAKAIVAPGKGILAADESTGTIGKRFDKIKVENTEANRRAYRELLFTTPGDWGKFIGGVILYEETLFQKTEDGKPFPELLREKGVLTGIKTDLGLVDIPGTDGEQATQGLDKLAERCQRYYEAGARFCKWRNVYKITDHAPTQQVIDENAHTLARMAAISQANGLMPIVEPEVLIDGTHSLARCIEVSTKVFAAVVKQLHEHQVLLEGILLKPNMITPGHESDEYKQCGPEQVALATVTVLGRTIPPAVPGIVFLSGGQDEEEATLNLNAMNAMAGVKRPWQLSFSYGRALQFTVQKTWSGKKENVKAAQAAFYARAEANSKAQLGQYKGGVASADGLYQKGYSY